MLVFLPPDLVNAVGPLGRRLLTIVQSRPNISKLFLASLLDIWLPSADKSTVWVTAMSC